VENDKQTSHPRPAAKPELKQGIFIQKS